MTFDQNLIKRHNLLVMTKHEYFHVRQIIALCRDAELISLVEL